MTDIAAKKWVACPPSRDPVAWTATWRAAIALHTMEGGCMTCCNPECHIIFAPHEATSPKHAGADARCPACGKTARVQAIPVHSYAIARLGRPVLPGAGVRRFRMFGIERGRLRAIDPQPAHNGRDHHPLASRVKFSLRAGIDPYHFVVGAEDTRSAAMVFASDIARQMLVIVEVTDVTADNPGVSYISFPDGSRVFAPL